MSARLFVYTFLGIASLACESSEPADDASIAPGTDARITDDRDARAPNDPDASTRRDAAMLPRRDAGSSLLFAMDYSEGAEPEAGWPGLADQDGNEGIVYTQTRVAGAGPSSQDVYRIQILEQAPGDGRDRQFNYGWRGGEVVDPPPADGTSIFWRLRLRFSADSNFRAINLEDESVDWSTKFFFSKFDTGNPDARAIFALTGRSNGTFEVGWMENVSGAEDVLGLPIGEWHDIQFEIAFGSGADASTLRLWVNNDEQSSPSSTRQGTFVAAHHGNQWLGAFANQGCRVGGIVSFDITDFEIATAFDPEWDQ